MRLVRVLYPENCILICNIPKKTLYENSFITCNSRISISHVMCLYSQSEWRTAVFTCGYKPIHDSVKAFASQSESCFVYIQIQIAFQIWLPCYRRQSASPSNFPAKAEESSRLVPVGCCSDVFVWHQENKNTSSTLQRDVSLLKKILVER